MSQVIADPIEKHFAAEAAKAEEDFQTYRRLLIKSAAIPLSSAEHAKFSGALSALKMTREESDADREKLRDAAKLEAEIAQLEKGAADLPAIESELMEFRARSSKILGELSREESLILNRKRQAENSSSGAIDRRSRLAELHQKDWRLFGDENPDEVAKRWHIVSGLFASPKGQKYQLRQIEDLFEMDQLQRQRSLRDPRYLFPVDGQSAEEMEALYDQLHSITFGPAGRIFYLIDAADLPRLARKNCSQTVHEAAADATTYRRSYEDGKLVLTLARTFVRHISQTPEQFEESLNILKKMYRKTHFPKAEAV